MKKFIFISLMLFSFVFVNKAIAQPTVNMVSVTDSITSYGIRMTGIVPSKGGWTVNAYGFIYDTLPMPTRATGAKSFKVGTTNLIEGTAFSAFPTSPYLLSGKTYYVRAFAAKSLPTPADTVFSSPLSVYVPMPTPPTLLMRPTTGISLLVATLNGTVVAKNDVSTFTGQGFVYSSTESMPTINNSTKITVPGSILTFPDSLSSNLINLISGQEYTVRCYTFSKYRNTNNRVDTIYSDTIKFKTLHACGAVPLNVNVDNVTETTARASFTTRLGQTVWQLDYEYAGHTPGTGTQVITTNDTVDLSGLTGGKSYSLFVRAVCDTVYSDWSAMASFTTIAPPCAPIYNIYVTEIRHSSAEISWMPGAMSQSIWEVCFTEATQNFPNVGTIIENNPVFTPIALTPQTQYKLKIRALCNDLLSNWSEDYYFTTAVSGLEDEVNEDVEKVIIYPNPTNGTINFKVENKEKISKIEIWSSLGELIYTSNVLPETYTLINQTKGLFLVKIFTNDYVQVEKVVLN